MATPQVTTEEANSMIESEMLKPGTRVRLRAPNHLLELKSDTGWVVRPDDWGDYYIIRLDQPALYHHADGHTEALAEVREDVDNMDVLTE